MTKSYGKFVWCELMTTDTEAATTFYGTVIGWKSRGSGIPDRDYSMFTAGERPVAGLMALPPSAAGSGAKVGWIGYIAVDDVDATAERIKAAGGRLHHGPDEIAGVGRFAVVADPQGAVFALFRPSGAGEGPPAHDPAPGHVGWHELSAANRDTAFDFYAGLFGWTKADAIDTGPMGVYQIFAAGGVATGGLMSRHEPKIPPAWLYYFNVDAIGAAMGRVNDAGGKVLNGPMQVPGGGWIAQCRDPQGGMFALYAPDR